MSARFDFNSPFISFFDERLVGIYLTSITPYAISIYAYIYIPWVNFSFLMAIQFHSVWIAGVHYARRLFLAVGIIKQRGFIVSL